MNKKILIIILCFLPLLSFAREIDVLCINDLHGNVMPYDKNLGMAKLVAAVKEKTKRHPDSIIVFGGDNYSGSPVSNFFYGAPVSDLARKLHIAASAVGNHEFDFGKNYLAKWSSAGNFPFVAANIFNAKTNRPVKWIKPYIMVKKRGIKIAIIGLATQETPYTTAPGKTKGLVFKDPAKCAQHWIDYLKSGKDSQGKPDLIIALTHIPSKQDFSTGKIIGSKELFSLCKNTRGLDAVVSAHSHLIVSGFVNHIPVVQGYCYGRALAYLKIMLNSAGKVIRIIPKVDLIYKRKNRIVPDKQMQFMLNRYVRSLPASYKQVIAISTGNFRHSIGGLKPHPLDVWMCSLLQKHFHTQVCMINGGFVRGDLLKGSITRLSMKRVVYFPNELITLKLSGADIYKLLEKAIPYGLQFSGLKVYYDLNAENHHVVKIILHGRAINRKKYYSIVINSFMLAGGDHESFSHAISVRHTHQFVAAKLADLVQQQKIIHPVRANNLIFTRN